MGKLFNKVKSRRSLERAWRKVHENARNSNAPAIRKEIAAFEQDIFGSIARLQRQLSEGKFYFAPQRGIAKRKQGTSKYRPLVVAPLSNRIIQRAILDVLVESVPAVKNVINTPTSIGGIRGRGTRCALDLVCKAIDQGARYFVRSDIEGFFTKIPKSKINEFLASHISDSELLSLHEEAMNTELENLDQLAEHKNLFPIGDDGVAQGSALSTLAGNILLQDFDLQLNARHITCVRYIDDFILLGPDEKRVKKTFDSAQAILAKFKMKAYPPWERRDKAECGLVEKGFTFLGCQVNPNGKLVQPSRKARQKLLKNIKQVLDDGLRAIREAINSDSAPKLRQRYCQTLVRLDGVISGWGHAFKFCNSRQTFDSLDNEIDNLVEKFHIRVRKITGTATQRTKRRALGVQLLRDISVGISVSSWPQRES